MTDLAGQKERIRLRIVGRVQGVGYRYFVLSRARELQLRGWVRNEDDGSVVVVAEGGKTSLDALVHAASKGPRSARVDSVSTEPVSAVGDHLGAFELRYVD